MARMSDVEFDSQLARARKVNAQRTEIDNRNGMMAPEQDTPAGWLRTGWMAVEAGVRSGDMSCCFEGIAMLQDLEKFLRS